MRTEESNSGPRTATPNLPVVSESKSCTVRMLEEEMRKAATAPVYVAPMIKAKMECATNTICV